jgi:5'-3' exonuclease
MMSEVEHNFEEVIIDVDSIVYQIAFTTPSPALAKKALDNFIKDIIETTDSGSALIFMKGSNNFRYICDPEYKNTRKDTIEPEIKERIEKLYEYAEEFCTKGEDGEADDYCSIYAKKALDEGRPYVVAHIDKDLNCIPGWHYNFRKKEFYFMDDSEAYRFLMMQVLTGDATDNIHGLRGVGEKTAIKLTKDTPNNLLWNKVIEIWKTKQPETWENNFLKCANCIYMRESLDDLRHLNFEELKERLTWNTDTGTLSQTDQTMPLDSSTMSKTSNQDADTSAESS